MTEVDRSGHAHGAMPVALVSIGGHIDATGLHIARQVADVENEPALVLGLLFRRLFGSELLCFAAVAPMAAWAHLIACVERQAEETGSGPALCAALDQERAHVRRQDWTGEP